MTYRERQTPALKIKLRVTGLAIANGRRADFEKSVEEMADIANSLGYLDPLDREPSIFFDAGCELLNYSTHHRD